VRRRSLASLALLPVLAASVSLAGCSSPNGPPGPTGTITGSLQAVGGAAGRAPRPLSGQVILEQPNGARAIISVGADGRFSVPATVGTYTVTGESPQYDGGAGVCRASGPVTITEGDTSHVEVDCQEK
jgi:hypothetical protein